MDTGLAHSWKRYTRAPICSLAAQGPRAAAIGLGFGGWRELTTRRKLGWSAGNSDGTPVCARSAIHSGEFDEPAGTWEADPDADVLTRVGLRVPCGAAKSQMNAAITVRLQTDKSSP